MNIIKNNNATLMYSLLQSHLDERIKKYTNDYYFSLVDDKGKVCGISRLTLLSENELSDKSRFIIPFKLSNSDLKKKIYYLSGIWVDEHQRNKGYGKALLFIRKTSIDNKSIIISDVKKDSPLLKYYSSYCKMKQLPSEAELFLFKKDL